MSDKEINNVAAGERRPATKNKKYNKTDVIAFGICLILAVVIWVYATNARYKEAQNNEDLPASPSVEETEQTE